jgi:hypothetical protein
MTAMRMSITMQLLLGAVTMSTACDGLQAGAASHAARNVAVQSDTVSAATLIAKMRGIDPVVCKLAVQVLGNQWGRGFPSGFPESAALNAEDRATLQWAASSAVERSAVPLLRRSLSDADACVRGTAARLLGRVRDASLATELRAELGSSTAATREAAVIALGYHDQPTGVDAALGALRDPEVNVRVAAIWALGMMEDARAITPLLALLQDDANASVRRAAAWALGRIEG